MGSSTPLAPDVDVLVVGAGPTGLTTACQLARFGVRFRIIDKQPDRARESRALGVQARSLEVLQALGLGEALAARGRSTTRLMLHVDRGAPVAIDLGTVPRADTRFPYILFVSQSDTEAVLGGYLEAAGARVERQVELVGFRDDSTGLVCVLRHQDGREEAIHASYLAGCDGAHSTVRKEADIAFEGGAYPQTFALGDVEADGALVPEAINAFAFGRGVAMFFPLGQPATWRVMAMEGTVPRPSPGGDDTVSTQQLSLTELQAMVDDPTDGAVRVRDPVWLTRFRLHHRQAVTYQHGRVFLAGDAAHIHSPVGAQGMNTGIQDGWNLGWKLAMVSRGAADARLLNSYHSERWPVGRTLLRATDRVFGVFARAVASGGSVTSLRRVVVRRVVAPALSSPRVRAFAFHFVSQLGIRYRKSPAVAEGEPRLSKGPHAGDRLPDARVLRNGQPAYLQQVLASPHVQLLLCGPVDAWNRAEVMKLAQGFPDVLAINYLTRENSAEALVDSSGEALTRLGVDRHATYLVRPDGHVAFRSGGTDLDGPAAYLAQWFTADRSRETLT
jgi:2-polyprenyl-6-methoxyphenol hydroxylase-like FAD-dependent oxidoreductase